MSDGMKVGLVILVIVLVGIPLAGKLAQEGKTSETAANDASAPNANKSVLPRPAAQPAPHRPAPQHRPQPRPQPGRGQGQGRGRGAGPQRPYWNAQNLVNTGWTFDAGEHGLVTAQFFSGGRCVAQSNKYPMQVEGTWRVNGSTLAVTGSAFGQTMTVNANIVGERIMAHGVSAKRIK